jgi:hypothetical protein
MTTALSPVVSDVLDAATYFVKEVARTSANLYVTGSISRAEFGFFAEVGGVSDVDLVISTRGPIGEYDPIMGLRTFLSSFDDQIQSSVCFVESSRLAGLRSSFAVDLGRRTAPVYTGFDESAPSHRLTRADCFEVFVHQLGLFYSRRAGIDYSRQETPRDTAMHLRKAVFELARAALVDDIANPTYSAVLEKCALVPDKLGAMAREVVQARDLDFDYVEKVLRSSIADIWDTYAEPFPIYDDCSLCTYAAAVIDGLGVESPVALAPLTATHVAAELAWATDCGPYLRFARSQGRTDHKSSFEAMRKDYFLARHAVMCGYDTSYCTGRQGL